MQQQQPQGRRFADTAPQQPIHRFPQNDRSTQGWQPQGNYAPPQFQQPAPLQEEEAPLSRRARRKQKRQQKQRRKRRFSLLWNLLAVVGLGTVLVQLARYVVIPLLVYLNVLSGGTL